MIGLIFTAFFALGLILISRMPSDVHLTHILYGNVLGIESDDVTQTLYSRDEAQAEAEELGHMVSARPAARMQIYLTRDLIVDVVTK